MINMSLTRNKSKAFSDSSASQFTVFFGTVHAGVLKYSFVMLAVHYIYHINKQYLLRSHFIVFSVYYLHHSNVIFLLASCQKV